MDQWMKKELSKCLCFDVPDAMINYIHTIKDGQEIDGYFRTLLDYTNPEHVAFITELKVRMSRGGKKEQVQPAKGNSKAGGKSKPAPKQTLPPKQNQPPIKPVKAKAASPSTAQPVPVAPPETSAKKKTVYVNMFGQDGKLTNEVLLKGRHRCDCQASKHRLVNNCRHCGRIVCEQEGSGPCLFCGSLVCTESEQRLIESASRKGDNLRRTLMEKNRPAGWEEALATRNRLLEYDRNSEKRTTVIDDESDYFKTNSVWLSDRERKKLEQLEEEMREKRHASRLSRKMTLDVIGRQMLEESSVPMTGEEIERLVSDSDAPSGQVVPNLEDNASWWPELGDDVHPGLCGPAPTYVETGKHRMQMVRPPGFDGMYSRVQDKEFLEMSDLRHCLSMHQPWASLLVAGIKRHEGRTWYSSHRGRLWIASTAKPVCPDAVRDLEAMYRAIYDDPDIEFPTQYPSGCLLGCVSLQECLPQEEYRKQYPNGESDSPYVFVCTEPQELPIRFPVKGDHKIYMLDSKIHQAAVKALQRMAKENKD